MRTTDEIYAEILLHPERDNLRAEFADACEGNDPERASFIREALQPWSVGTWPRKVSRALKERLMTPLRRLGDVGCMFSRGFVEGIAVEPAVFVEHGLAMFELAPIIEVAFITQPTSLRARTCPLTPEVVASPAFKLVRHVHLAPDELFTYQALNLLLDRPDLDLLLELDTRGPFYMHLHDSWAQEQEREMWPRLFASPVFRRMIRWGLDPTSRKVGDRVHIEPDLDLDYEIVTYLPMPPEDRAIEEQYGYIPQLHAANWDTTILEVLRGEKPAFPVGARPTPAMYEVPPPLRRRALGRSR